MGFETLILTREESYAVITLNRPPANAISEALMQELNAALSSVQSDDTVRSVIVTGSGEDRRSENQTESISVFSHRSTKRQKKSRPAGPPGQGPGMTPTRYLICMGWTLARVDRLSGAPVE